MDGGLFDVSFLRGMRGQSPEPGETVSALDGKENSCPDAAASVCQTGAPHKQQ